MAIQRKNTIRIKLPKIAQLVVFPFTKSNVFYHEIKVQFVGFGFHFSIYLCRKFSSFFGVVFFACSVPLFRYLFASFASFFVLSLALYPFLSARWQFWLSRNNCLYVCIYQLIRFGECEKGWIIAIRQTLLIKINVHVFILRHALQNVPHFCVYIVCMSNGRWTFSKTINSTMIFNCEEFKFIVWRGFCNWNNFRLG